MISVAKAQEIIQSLISERKTEKIPIENSVGRRLKQDIIADRNGPPFHRVAMDGFALCSSETQAKQNFKIEGLQIAGMAPQKKAHAFQAMEVATGAVLPLDFDTVIPYEKVAKQTENEIEIPEALRPFENVHLESSDYKKGDILIKRDSLISSPQIHIFASIGLTEIEVEQKLRFSLLGTGDELVEIHENPLPHQIRRSNTHAISAEARAWGLFESAHHIARDDEMSLSREILFGLENSDVLIITGGVSKGARDLIPEILKNNKVETLFHEVMQKPGKPLFCGKTKDGKIVFGLPGNPVSSLFAFRRYVLPLLLGYFSSLPLQRSEFMNLPKLKEGFTHFLPIQKNGKDNELMSFEGSGNYFALSKSSGFIEYNANDEFLSYYPWGGCL